MNACGISGCSPNLQNVAVKLLYQCDQQGLPTRTFAEVVVFLTNSLPFVRLISDLHVWIVLSDLSNQLCWSETDCLDIVRPGGKTTKQGLVEIVQYCLE